MCNWNSLWEECVCVDEYVNHIGQLLNFSLSLFSFLQCCLCLCNVTLQFLCNQISRAISPSMRNPASKEMISDSLELWDTDVVFLHIQLTGTKCSTFEDAQNPPLRLILSSQKSPAKSEFWNEPTRQCQAVLTPHPNIVEGCLCGESMTSILPIVCHMLSSIWWRIEQISLLSRRCQVPIRVKYKNFKTICEHTCDISPTDSSSF